MMGWMAPLRHRHAAGRWELNNGGEYYAAGVGTAIVGFRANGALIDDPIRSREDADSQHVRDKIWDWYKSDFLTRLAPGGWVILIQTRWHEDDLAGRIIAEMEGGGERWDIVSLPAEAEAGDLLGREPGQWLWDDAYGYGDFLRHEKATQPPRNWSALYQQCPAPETGDYFKARAFSSSYAILLSFPKTSLDTRAFAVLLRWLRGGGTFAFVA
jgi:hypothetical protein